MNVGNKIIWRSILGYRIEVALRSAPGMIFGHLEGGGMIVDWDSGEFVEGDQVIKDPLHIEKLNVLNEDHLGCMKLGLTTNDLIGDDEQENDDEVALADNAQVREFSNRDQEIDFLTQEQAEDLLTCCGSTKGRHAEFCKEKTKLKTPSKRGSQKHSRL